MDKNQNQYSDDPYPERGACPYCGSWKVDNLIHRTNQCYEAELAAYKGLAKEMGSLLKRVSYATPLGEDVRIFFNRHEVKKIMEER